MEVSWQGKTSTGAQALCQSDWPGDHAEPDACPVTNDDGWHWRTIFSNRPGERFFSMPGKFYIARQGDHAIVSSRQAFPMPV
jgi:hypothetical protein